MSLRPSPILKTIQKMGERNEKNQQQTLQQQTNNYHTSNVIMSGGTTISVGGAVAWWLTPRTPDPEVGRSSPTRVAVLCP